ncbi:MAG TPA: nucleotide sugar dehydrogenase [Anaerolineales bacterium]|nr:nucleotide sugar dehydrogenase [Anaerolineales bacterium]
MGSDTPGLPAAAENLIERFRSRQAEIGIVGLGYVGLPLAIVLAEAGFKVTGIDLDPKKVEAIRRGESYIEDIPSAEVAALVQSGRLQASSDFGSLAGADGVSICVPTPLRKTGDPDLSFIVSATQALRPALHAGMVVILESTTYPGTTRELVVSELDRPDLQVGHDFFVAFSPERVDPGRQDWTTKNTPKVIGGITPACTAVAAAMYEQAIETIVPVSSAEVAEMTKLLENTFRAVNIAMVNEMVLMCDRLGLDVWEVIEAASTKPFGYMRFLPGPGLGGHCIPIDPLYLSWKMKSMKYNARIIDLASEINTNMPRYVVERVQDALNQRGKALRGSRLLVVGVAYKPDISDIRESPALDVIGLLRGKGAEVAYYDPHVPSLEHEGWGLTSVDDLAAEARRSDCVVIITHHSAIDYRSLVDAASLIFDTRNAVGGAGIRSPKVLRL